MVGCRRCIMYCLSDGFRGNDFALPFLFFNDLMKKVARPLTSPRLLVMSLVAFVCIVDGISNRHEKKTTGVGPLVSYC